MKENKQNVEKAIRQYQATQIGKKLLVATVACIALGVIIILPKIPIGSATQVSAEVVSIGHTQSPTGTGIRLVCKLNNEKQVHVFLDNPSTAIKIGSQVTLAESSYLIGDNKYKLLVVNKL